MQQPVKGIRFVNYHLHGCLESTWKSVVRRCCGNCSYEIRRVLLFEVCGRGTSPLLQVHMCGVSKSHRTIPSDIQAPYYIVTNLATTRSKGIMSRINHGFCQYRIRYDASTMNTVNNAGYTVRAESVPGPPWSATLECHLVYLGM